MVVRMISPLLLYGRKLRFLFFIVASYLIGLSQSVLAYSAGKAKILRCGQKNTSRCELISNLSLSDGQNIELYRGSKLVYSGSILRKQQQKYAKKYTKHLVEGEWYIKSSKRVALMKSNALLLLVTSHRQSDEDFRFASHDEEIDSEPSTLRTAPSQNYAQKPPVDTEPSTIEKIEKWASRSDGHDTPRLNIGLRLGTPNSPSAMTGVNIDLFLISTVIPITLAAGEYDSRRFVNADKYGRLKYQTQSIGTGLLIGKSWTRFKIGLNYTEIHAKFSSKDKSLGYESKSTTYTGLTPHLGLYGISSGEASYGLEYGFFVPFTSSYKTDPGAPYRSTSQPQAYRNRPQYFSLGFGLAF